MTKHNDGGTAFPMPGVYDRARDQVNPVDAYYHAGGMSMRAYYASSAPADIPNWFAGPSSKIVVPNSPREVIDTAFKENRISADDHRAALSWLLDPCFDIQSDLRWFEDHTRLYNERKREVEAENKVLRYFAWRWYYADMMIASGQWSPTKLEGG